MTYKVIISTKADSQLRHIYDYIANKASPVVAEQFTSRILDYCLGFDIFPERGVRRDDLSPGLRVVGFRRTVTITFVIENDEVIISGIFYGGEDHESLLSIGEP